MHLYYLGLLPVIFIVILFYMASRMKKEIKDDPLGTMVVAIVSSLLVLFLIFGIVIFVKGVINEVNAQTTMTASVKLTPENEYTTCLSECEQYK